MESARALSSGVSHARVRVFRAGMKLLLDAPSHATTMMSE